MPQSVPGTWNILGWKPRDYGATELFNTATGRDTSNPATNNPAVYQATVGASQPTAQQKQNTVIVGGGPQPVLSGNKTPTTKSSDKTGGGQVQGATSPTGGYTVPEGPNVDALAQGQQDAAAAAAEAKRQAAMRKYQAQTQIAETAKGQAEGEYNWLLETLGSNKKDLLEQVTLNEQEGVTGYQQQEGKTKQQYDSAKQEILSTYRDLGRQQEKIMRGAGMSNSSRMMEAQNRLNALLGKDMSQVTTNEADSLALIGNAVSALKNRTLQTKNSIETESKSKMDKAALDYKAQVDAINNNLYLSANEREDAYGAAEAQLADDSAKIATWAAGLKANVEVQKMQLKAQLDQFIMSMTDSKGLLTQGLGEKTTALNTYLTNAKYTPLDVETGATQYQSGAGRTQNKPSLKTAEDVQNALNQGSITAIQAQEALRNIGTGPVAAQDPLMAALMSGPTANSSATLRANDPLFAVM